MGFIRDGKIGDDRFLFLRYGEVHRVVLDGDHGVSL
jgi:hypothetical protein